MNCEAYIVTSNARKLSFFPDNFDKAPLQKAFGRGSIGDNEVGVHRVGDLVYYIYLRRLEDVSDTFVGIALAINSVMVDDVVGLHAFCQKIMRSMACQYNVAYFVKSKAEYRESPYSANYEGAVHRLRTAFCSKFDGKEVALGTRHYSGTSEKKRLHIPQDRGVIHLDTDQGQYSDALMRQYVQQGDTVIISSAVTDEEEIARLNTKVAALVSADLEKRSIIEKQTLKINSLETQLKYLRDQQTNTKNDTSENQPPPSNKNKVSKMFFSSVLSGGLLLFFAYFFSFPYWYSQHFAYTDSYGNFIEIAPSWVQFKVFISALAFGMLLGWQKLRHQVIYEGGLLGFWIGCILWGIWYFIVGAYHYDTLTIMNLVSFLCCLIGIVGGIKIHKNWTSKKAMLN